MEKILILLITAVINQANDFVGGNMLSSIMSTALYAEEEMARIGAQGFSSLFKIFLDLGISLIILKFLKKGFQTYVLWTEGDPDAEPILLLTGFMKAMAIALGFPVIYTWLVDIITELTDVILGATRLNEVGDFLTGDLLITGLLSALLYLIFFILFFLLWIQFIKRGLELLILRLGFPLVCSGLMDADQGIFKSYTQKLLQGTITVLIQITLAKLSLVLMMGGHFIWGIATISLSLKTPRFLQDFLITTGGGGGMMNTAYSTARLIQMMKK